MNVRQTKDFSELSGLPGYIVEEKLQRFARICKQLNRINEEECNEGLSELSARREKRLQDEAEAIAAMLKCGLYSQGDPRGAAIRLVRPDGRSNNFDGETWFVED